MYNKSNEMIRLTSHLIKNGVDVQDVDGGCVVSTKVDTHRRLSIELENDTHQPQEFLSELESKLEDFDILKYAQDHTPEYASDSADAGFDGDNSNRYEKDIRALTRAKNYLAYVINGARKEVFE